MWLLACVYVKELIKQTRTGDTELATLQHALKEIEVRVLMNA